MANARGCGRLGLLAVGLGIGAALATIPGPPQRTRRPTGCRRSTIFWAVCPSRPRCHQPWMGRSQSTGWSCFRQRVTPLPQPRGRGSIHSSRIRWPTAAWAGQRGPKDLRSWFVRCCVARLASGNAREQTHSETSSNYLCTNDGAVSTVAATDPCSDVAKHFANNRVRVESVTGVTFSISVIRQSDRQEPNS